MKTPEANKKVESGRREGRITAYMGREEVRTFVADEKVRRFHVQMHESRRVNVPQRPFNVFLNLPHYRLRYLPP